jgi:hypothetical protein
MKFASSSSISNACEEVNLRGNRFGSLPDFVFGGNRSDIFMQRESTIDFVEQPEKQKIKTAPSSVSRIDSEGDLSS